MSAKGKPVLGEMPPARVRADYDWAAGAILARMHAGKPVRAAVNVPMSRIKSVRKYRMEPFVTDEGHIVVNMRNSHVDEKTGTRVGDVYLTWVPNETKEN